MFSIVALDNQERFLGFIDPDLVNITRINSDGLKSIRFTYTIDDLPKAKKYFQMGNKLWVSGDVNEDDCLYVINAPAKEDLYLENTFECEC